MRERQSWTDIRIGRAGRPVDAKTGQRRRHVPLGLLVAFARAFLTSSSIFLPRYSSFLSSIRRCSRRLTIASRVESLDFAPPLPVR
jgi:hypothetical protein